MKTLKQIKELYTQNTKDGKEFVNKHKVAKTPDANKNGDDVFNASNVKDVKRQPAHGYDPGDDEKVYEEVEDIKEYEQHKYVDSSGQGWTTDDDGNKQRSWPSNRPYYGGNKPYKSRGTHFSTGYKDGDKPHAVHINGKKWKEFGSKQHAENVARKLGSKATVHSVNEEVELDEGKNPRHIKTVYGSGRGKVKLITHDGKEYEVSAKDTNGKMPKPGEHISKYVNEEVELHEIGYQLSSGDSYSPSAGGRPKPISIFNTSRGSNLNPAGSKPDVVHLQNKLKAVNPKEYSRSQAVLNRPLTTQDIERTPEGSAGSRTTGRPLFSAVKTQKQIQANPIFKKEEFELHELDDAAGGYPVNKKPNTTPPPKEPNQKSKPKTQTATKATHYIVMPGEKIAEDTEEVGEGYVSDAQRKAVWANRNDGGKGHPDKKKKMEEAANTKLDEVAPPGAKFERMVKHIKKSYSETDKKLTPRERRIAYATAWKNYNKNKG